MDGIAAGYGRTSKEKDDGFSLDSQFESIRQVAADMGITLPIEFELREEFTGRVLERPKLHVLRKLVREGKISTIIIYATDRLSRKLGGADILLDEFFYHKVQLYIVTWSSYVTDTPEDRLRFNFESLFSDFERRKITERMSRGKKDKLRQGLYLGDGNPPYGYRKVGQKKDMHLEIIEEEAAVIRQIYEWYALENVTVPEITRRLRGIPTPAESKGIKFPLKRRGAGEWAEGTVYLILRNTAYIGELHKWGATISVPAIIEPALYAKVREHIGQPQPFHTPRYEYLIGRRLKCGYCGYSISSHPHGGTGKKPRLYYRCPSWREKLAKSKCSLPLFPVHLVDETVWQWICTLLLHPESLRVMLKESQKELQEQTHELTYRLVRVEERLRMEEQRLGVILRQYIESEARGDTSPAALAVREVYRQTKEHAEQLFTELTHERDTLREALSGSTIDDSAIDELFTFAQAVRDDVDNLPFAGRREIIEQLDVRGELAFEDGQRVLYIVWHTHRFRHVL